MINNNKYLLKKGIHARAIFVLIFCFCCFISSAQQNRMDSLRLVLKNINANTSSEFSPTVAGEKASVLLDTNAIYTLNNLAWELKNNNPDTAIILAMQALNLSRMLFREKENQSPLGKLREACIGKCYQNIGAFNYLKGNYSQALDYDFKALKIKESLNDKKKIASIHNNIGTVYERQGDYPKALDHYFKALKMAEELGNKNIITTNLSNIGTIYYHLNDYPQALNNYFKALKLAEETGDVYQMAANLAGIGNIYYFQKEYSHALEYDFKALKLAKELGDQIGMAKIINNLGTVYDDQKDYSKALTYDFKALKLEEQLGDKNGLVVSFDNIGNVYLRLNKYKDAELYLQKALTLATEIRSLDLVRQTEEVFIELYTQIHEPVKALEHYKKYIVAKDSIFNEENTKKTLRSEMNFDFEKKQAIEKAEQEKQNEIAQQEKQKQKIILFLVSCFLLLVAVFASFMFNRWRVAQRQKLIIEKHAKQIKEEKEKLEKANVFIIEQNKMMETQKKLVEEKNKNITDSIDYAKTIQEVILPTEEFRNQIFSDSFVLFKPKDIVSGDFYWYSEKNNKKIIAACDCTGHGVPGALMSMIASNLLNLITNEKEIFVPSEILRLLNIGIYEALHQGEDGALARDGLDMALCCIDYEKNELQYAGAQNPLYVLTDNELTVINGNNQTVGGGGFLLKKKDPLKIEYTNHIIPIEKEMSIFLFSDGYMDQFGGSDGKKFGIQKFKELVLNNQHLSMQKQKELFLAAHQDWKGNTAQVDDVLVMGVRL
jgi:serine phosphatase RsbU (regulator of sigma subunit)/tetratricopeptide (TPR) repeat protein